MSREKPDFPGAGRIRRVAGCLECVDRGAEVRRSLQNLTEDIATTAQGIGRDGALLRAGEISRADLAVMLGKIDKVPPRAVVTVRHDDSEEDAWATVSLEMKAQSRIMIQMGEQPGEKKRGFSVEGFPILFEHEWKTIRGRAETVLNYNVANSQRLSPVRPRIGDRLALPPDQSCSVEEALAKMARDKRAALSFESPYSNRFLYEIRETDKGVELVPRGKSVEELVKSFLNLSPVPLPDAMKRAAFYKDGGGFGFEVVEPQSRGEDQWFFDVKPGDLCVAVGQEFPRNETPDLDAFVESHNCLHGIVAITVGRLSPTDGVVSSRTPIMCDKIGLTKSVGADCEATLKI